MQAFAIKPLQLAFTRKADVHSHDWFSRQKSADSALKVSRTHRNASFSTAALQNGRTWLSKYSTEALFAFACVQWAFLIAFVNQYVSDCIACLSAIRSSFAFPPEKQTVEDSSLEVSEAELSREIAGAMR